MKTETKYNSWGVPTAVLVPELEASNVTYNDADHDYNKGPVTCVIGCKMHAIDTALSGMYLDLLTQSLEALVAAGQNEFVGKVVDRLQSEFKIACGPAFHGQACPTAYQLGYHDHLGNYF